MSQTAYSVNQGLAFAGMKAGLGPDHVQSYVNAAAIGMGLAVVRDGADDKIKAPASSPEALAMVGVVLHSHALESSASGEAQWPLKSAVPVMKNGHVMVKVEEAVVAGDPVFVRFAAGAGGTILGSFRKSADTATAVEVPGLRYVVGAGAAGIAELAVNLP